MVYVIVRSHDFDIFIPEFIVAPEQFYFNFMLILRLTPLTYGNYLMPSFRNFFCLNMFP